MPALATTSQFQGAEIEFRNELLMIDPRGCLFWPSENMLIVSDLHLEKGSSFAARHRVFLPPYDTKATLQRLATCIAEWNPKRVLSLGDGFHDDEAGQRLSKDNVAHLRELMSGRDWIWLAGNHDPKPPENLGGTHCTSMHIGALNFIHEPGQDFAGGEIAGHLHPNAKIRQRGKSVKRRCLVGDEQRLIMPAFGAFTGGLNVLHEAYNGLFEPSSLRGWLLGSDTIYEMSGKRFVG